MHKDMSGKRGDPKGKYFRESPLSRARRLPRTTLTGRALTDESVYVFPFNRPIADGISNSIADSYCALDSIRIMMAGMFNQSLAVLAFREPTLIAAPQIRGQTIRLSRTKAGPLEFNSDILGNIFRYWSRHMADARHAVGLVVESEGRLNGLRSPTSTDCPRSCHGIPIPISRCPKPRCTTWHHTTTCPSSTIEPRGYRKGGTTCWKSTHIMLIGSRPIS